MSQIVTCQAPSITHQLPYIHVPPLLALVVATPTATSRTRCAVHEAAHARRGGGQVVPRPLRAVHHQHGVVAAKHRSQVTLTMK